MLCGHLAKNVRKTEMFADTDQHLAVLGQQRPLDYVDNLLQISVQLRG